jgi:hypothetical protein
MTFEVNYERADEPSANYRRVVPADLFKALYPGFGTVFAIRAKPGDSAAMCMGLEKWNVKVQEDRQNTQGQGTPRVDYMKVTYRKKKA